MNYFRFVSGNKGIFEAVDVDCPKGDLRRKNKPDGSWLPKVGKKYPGAVSYWSQKGLEKYAQSGLMDWHASVVNHPVKILVIVDKPIEILYEDEYQIIVDPMEIVGTKTIDLETLRSEYFKGVDFKGGWVARTYGSMKEAWSNIDPIAELNKMRDEWDQKM